MSALFRRRRPPEPDPEPYELPEHLRNLPDQAVGDASATLYVAGDVRFVRARTGRVHLARYASDHLPLVADLEIVSGPARSAGAERSHASHR